MLIATQGKSVAGTQHYFEQVLTQGDYYLGQEVAGRWHGKGADQLGLGHGSEVTPEQFNNLLRGYHPETGVQLAQRTRQDRRPGMDLTFSVPKSVSLAWAINGDERILTALRESVHETMRHDVEPLMQRRVRDGEYAKSKQKLTTGKLIYADFLHKTSRPVDGKPDPHLHVHAFVVNWTQHQGKHYAGEFEEIVRQRPSLQAKFEARMARKLQQQLGYAVEKVRYYQSGRMKSGWELCGLDRRTIEKFSRRTAQVEEHAKENGITDAFAKAKLGKLTREKKDPGKSVAELRTEWQGRLTQSEHTAFENLKRHTTRAGDRSEIQAAKLSIQHALEHHLQRQSTVEQHQVVGTALEHGLTLRPEIVEKVLNSMELIKRTRDDEGAKRTLLTTRKILDAERQMIGFVRDGKGTRKAIGDEKYRFSRDWLNDAQRNAVLHVLQSRDTVMAVTGGAGTGKSSLMQEADEAIRQCGKRVYAFAPSTGAREVLESKGFDNAQTVEHLIRNTRLHPHLKDQVIWIDECGLMDVRSMNAVFQVAKEQNARVVLSGDTRQHATVGRGEAMRLLEKEARLKSARVEVIQRQKGQYRKAVELTSRGNQVVDLKTRKTGLLAGFDLLDQMGKIKEFSQEDGHQHLADAYRSSIQNGKSTLVVAPTHAEAALVTDLVRNGLKKDGLISEAEVTVTQLRSLQLTDAEKREVATYRGENGLIVQLHQNLAGGYKRGDRYRVENNNSGKMNMVNLKDGSKREIPIGAPNRFEVYREYELKIAEGDQIRFSLGGKTMDGRGRISNGRLDQVTGFDRKGNLILKNGRVVDANYGHLDLGYVITSHASQGKDRQVAMAAMGSTSLPAINARQFYVTISRGSEDVAIFVDNKQQVRRSIERSGQQMSATELVSLPGDGDAVESERLMDVANRWMDQSRQAFGNYRDRLTHWCKQQNEHRSVTGNEPKMIPGLERSRQL